MARRMAFPPGGGGTFGQQRNGKNSQFFHVFYLTFSDHGGMMDSRNEENVPLNRREPSRIKMALGYMIRSLTSSSWWSVTITIKESCPN